MRYTPQVFPLLAASIGLGAAMAQPVMTVETVKVGSQLQAVTHVDFPNPVPGDGFEIKITSDDPKRLKLSRRPDVAGTSTLMMPVQGGFKASPEFWVHVFDGQGEATYTVSAPGYAPLKGKAAMFPSAVLLVGPYKASAFKTQPSSTPSRILVYTGRLEADGSFGEQQLLSGGVNLSLKVVSSNPEVGTITSPEVAFPGGEPNMSTEFKPAGAAGKAEIMLAVIPPGFSKAPPQYEKLSADVVLPGMSLTTEVYLGENLMMGGSLGLGAFAPKEGVEVTIESQDPTRLLLSNGPAEMGKAKITVKVAGGQVGGSYYLHGLGRKGKVRYTATAKGFTTREAVIGMAPSGVTISPNSYGPPDEAELFRKGPEEDRGFVAHLSHKENKMPLVVWMHHLDPETMRAADVTVQSVRPGVEFKIPVALQDPTLGKLSAPFVTIKSGQDAARLEFFPLKEGATRIKLTTPKELAGSANSTSVPVIIRQ